jgi:hypothetical protein
MGKWGLAANTFKNFRSGFEVAVAALRMGTRRLQMQSEARNSSLNQRRGNGKLVPLAVKPASRRLESDISEKGSNRALVIGRKSGMVHAVDPDRNGNPLWQTRTGAGGALGGSQWGSAADGQQIYVAISDIGIGGVADPKAPGGFRLTLDPKKGRSAGWTCRRRTGVSRSIKRGEFGALKSTRIFRRSHCVPFRLAGVGGLVISPNPVSGPFARGTSAGLRPDGFVQSGQPEP